MMKQFKTFIFLSSILILFSSSAIAQLAATAVVNQNVSCFGGNDGEIQVDITGGTANFTIDLVYFVYGFGNIPVGSAMVAGGPPQSVVFNNTSPEVTWGGGIIAADGTTAEYRVLITSADVFPNNVLLITSIILTEPLPLDFSGTTTLADCDGSGSGVINVQANGGTAPYIIKYVSGPTAFPDGNIATDGGTVSIGALLAGDYDVQIEDANSCLLTNTFTVSAAPIDQPISEPAATTVCEGTSQTVTLTNSEAGVDYQVLLNGNPIGVPIPGTGGVNHLLGTISLVDGLTVAGSPHTITVEASIAGCTLALTDNIIVTVNAYPIDATITEQGAQIICEGSDQTVTLDNSELGTNYQIMLDGVPFGGSVAGSGGANHLLGTILAASLTPAGSPYLITVDAIRNGCPLTLSQSINVTVNALPIDENIVEAGPQSICEGDSQPVTLATSENGVLYTIFLDGAPTGTSNTGDGSASFLIGSVAGILVAGSPHAITVVATVGGCPITLTDQISVTVKPLPIDETITEQGAQTICEGSDQTVTLDNSELGTDYQIMLDGVPFGGSVAGSGGANHLLGTILAASLTPAGSPYLITVDAIRNGCPLTLSQSINVTVNALPIDENIVEAGPQSICEGDSQPVTLATSENGVLYTIFLDGAPTGTSNTGDGSASFLIGSVAGILVAGSPHAITVVATVGGCPITLTDQISVTVKPLPIDETITEQGAQTICEGSDQTVTLDNSELGTDYQIMLDGVPFGGLVAGSGGANHLLGTILAASLTPAGSPYLITVDAIRNGCPLTLSQSINVTVNALPIDENIVEAGPQSICEGDSQPVTLATSENGVLYTIFLDGAPTGTSNTGDGSASFLIGSVAGLTVAGSPNTITVEASIAGCTLALTDNIIVTVNAYPIDATITEQGAQIICEGSDQTVTLDNSELGTDYQIMLDGVPFGGSVAGSGGANHLLGTILAASLTPAGSPYLITVDAIRNGCPLTLSQSINVTVNALPIDENIVEAGPQSICEGDSQPVTLATSENGVLYTIFLDGAPTGTSNTGDGSASFLIGSVAGLTVAGSPNTITVEASIAGCTLALTGNIIVTVDPSPDATITAAGPFCETDASVNLVAATVGGIWTGTGITDGALGTFDPVTSGPGTHTITYTLTIGACVSVDTEDITVDTSPDATITPAGPFCEPDISVNLIAATTGGTWSGTGITDPVLGTFDPAVALTGIHTITYTVTNGACISIDTEDITVLAVPDPAINPAGPFCISDANTNLTAVAPGGAWSGNGITDTVLGTFSPSTAGIGMHTISYTLANAGCSAIGTIDIDVVAPPSAAITGPVSVCSNTTEAYSVPAGEAGYVWTLTSADGVISSGLGTNSITVDWATSNGGLEVTVTGAAPTSCISTSNASVTVFSILPPLATQSSDFCQNDGLPTLVASPEPGATVSWYIGSSATGTLVGTGDTYTPTATELDMTTPGTTIFTYIQDIVCLASLDADYTVNILALPNAGISNSIATCGSDGNIDLFALLGGTPDVGGMWTDDDSSGGLSGDIFDPAASGAGTFNFTYQVDGTGACSAASETAVVTVAVSSGVLATIGEVVNTYPEQDIGAIEVINIISDDLPIEISLEDNSGAVIYDWVTLEANRIGEFSFIFTLLQQGDYVVVVRDGTNCDLRIPQAITLETNVFIPNVITPNGDGYNEFFKILNMSSPVQIQISNRWGVSVFESNDYQNDWQGASLPDGVYFYSVKMGGQVYKGNVEVWRNNGSN